MSGDTDADRQDEFIPESKLITVGTLITALPASNQLWNWTQLMAPTALDIFPCLSYRSVYIRRDTLA